MAGRGLLDILIAGASWRFRPWKETVTLGHKYGVPVYANPTEGSVSPEAYRGRTLAAWASGVDGIYTFNETEPDSPVWNELGDPEKLLELDRMTPVENARIERHERSHINRLPGVSRFLARASRLPFSLPTGEEKSFEFTAGEDGPRVATSTTPHVSLHVQFHNLEDGDEITVVLQRKPTRIRGDAARLSPARVDHFPAGSLVPALGRQPSGADSDRP